MSAPTREEALLYVAQPQRERPIPAKCGRCHRGNIWDERQTCAVCGAENIWPTGVHPLASPEARAFLNTALAQGMKEPYGRADA